MRSGPWLFQLVHERFKMALRVSGRAGKAIARMLRKQEKLVLALEDAHRLATTKRVGVKMMTKKLKEMLVAPLAGEWTRRARQPVRQPA